MAQRLAHQQHSKFLLLICSFLKISLSSLGGGFLYTYLYTI